MATLDQFRARVGRLMQNERFISSSATSGSTTTLVDTTALQNAHLGEVYYQGNWVLLTAGSGSDRERLINSYTPSTGTLTWTTALGTAVTTNAYELYDLRPTYLEAMINEALERVYTLEEVAVAPAVNGDRQISLASLTWLTAPDDQFVSLEQRIGTTINQYVYRAVEGVEIRRDRDAYTLNLMGKTFLTTDTLILRAWFPYSGIGTLSTPTSTSSAPLDWVAWEVVREVIERQMTTVATEESGALGRLFALATKRCAEMKAKYMPRDQARIRMWDTTRFHYGAIGVGGGGT